MPPARRRRSRAHWIPVVLLALVVAVVLFIVLSSSGPPTGYDASYPQCSNGYPGNVLFGIVGVDGGLAHDANPCLDGELSWARGAPGQRRPRQPALSLYIDTGNPGDHISIWPKHGRTPVYGSCNGLLTNACSYLYGVARAEYSYRLVASHDAAAARTAPWWLDVETQLSWAATYQLNVAALRGYIAGLHDAGATGSIGVYSTGAQWHEITGLAAQSTTKAFGLRLPDWVAGTGAALAQARQNCAGGGFTGLAPTLAQYQVGGYDADFRC